MKKFIMFFLVMAMVALMLPLDSVLARGGGGRGRGGISGGARAGRATSRRSSNKNKQKLRERSRIEEEDSLLRDVRQLRQGTR
jgi:hypothetical protein